MVVGVGSSHGVISDTIAFSQFRDVEKLEARLGELVTARVGPSSARTWEVPGETNTAAALHEACWLSCINMPAIAPTLPTTPTCPHPPHHPHSALTFSLCPQPWPSGPDITCLPTPWLSARRSEL